MPDITPTDRLVEDLAAGVTPVRRLSSPWVRTFEWSSAAIALGLVFLPFMDTAGLATRMAVPDIRYAALGAVATAFAAALAAFQTSVPGRSAYWILLPLPPLAVWLGASGLGCLRDWVAPGTDVPDMHEMRGCFTFIMGVSIPLSALLITMLRKACPLRPTMTAALGGLAAAAASAALLVPFHPHDATATDLLVHTVAVSLVVGCNGAVGRSVLNVMRAAGLSLGQRRRTRGNSAKPR